MRLTPMRYKDYTWPHNPEVYQVECRREVAALKVPFGGYVLHIFTADPAVLEIGIAIIHFLVPTFFTYVTIEIYSGSLRGIGDSWFPMILTMLGVCALRVIWLLLVVPMHRTIHMIVFSYPLTWSVTTILFLIYFHGFSRLGRRGYITKQDNSHY